MDRELRDAIELMAKGEEKGFNEIYSKTYNRVYFRAKQIMKKEEDAQDLTQIVFVEAYKNIQTLQSIDAFYGWLDGITYRQGMKLFRKQREVLLSQEAEGLFDTLENNDVSAMPELTADQRATSEIVKGIIEELPELQKTAVVMFYFDGLKVEQIADMMECSVNTIKSRLNYARKYIKEKVEAKEKAEGYRLHAVGLPVLWFAIRTIADNTILTTSAAQAIYSGSCAALGLKATAITLAGTTATITGVAIDAAVETTTAGTSALGATAAGTTVAGTATGAAATTLGIGAKFAAMSMVAKSLIIAGSIAIAGAGTVGVVYLSNHSSQVEENDVHTLGEGDIFEEISEQFGTDSELTINGNEQEVNGNGPENTSIMSDNPDSLKIEDDLSAYITVRKKDDWNKFICATKISDTEYCFYANDLKNEFSQDEWVMVNSDLPKHLGVCYVEIVQAPNYEFVDAPKTINEYRNISFELQADYNITIMVDYMENITYKSDEVNEQKSLELSEEAKRQLTSFVAATYEYDFYDITIGQKWTPSIIESSEYMFFVKDYIGMVNYCFTGSPATNAMDLPFDWINYNVTQQEIETFFESGLGLDVPDNYTYSAGDSELYIRIQNGKLVCTYDDRTVQAVGGNLEIISDENNMVVLEGNAYLYYPEKYEIKFTIEGIRDGNENVFDGITITGVVIDEEIPM